MSLIDCDKSEAAKISKRYIPSVVKQLNMTSIYLHLLACLIWDYHVEFCPIHRDFKDFTPYFTTFFSVRNSTIFQQETIVIQVLIDPSHLSVFGISELSTTPVVNIESDTTATAPADLRDFLITQVQTVTRRIIISDTINHNISTSEHTTGEIIPDSGVTMVSATTETTSVSVYLPTRSFLQVKKTHVSQSSSRHPSTVEDVKMWRQNISALDKVIKLIHIKGDSQANIFHQLKWISGSETKIFQQKREIQVDSCVEVNSKSVSKEELAFSIS